MHLNQLLLFEKFAKQYFTDGMKVLEIGPNDYPSAYEKIISNNTITWDTLDISDKFNGRSKENSRFIFSTELYKYPIESDSYDIIISAAVMMAVPDIWSWMNELKRIVKPNGLIITITPISWPNNHSPIDCWRVYPDGLKGLNENCNLKTLICEFDSLELESFGYSRSFQKIPNFTVPNISLTGYNNVFLSSTKIHIFINTILSKIPFIRRFMNPIRIAYDTISISQKN